MQPGNASSRKPASTKPKSKIEKAIKCSIWQMTNAKSASNLYELIREASRAEDATMKKGSVRITYSTYRPLVKNTRLPHEFAGKVVAMGEDAIRVHWVGFPYKNLTCECEFVNQSRSDADYEKIIRDFLRLLSSEQKPGTPKKHRRKS